MADFDPVSYMMGQKAAEGGGGGGSSTLSGLTDVDISNPSDGQTLVFNATSGKWENSAGGGGGGALVVEFQENSDCLNKTGQEIKDAFLNSAVFLVYEDSTEMISERCEAYGIYENVHVFIFESKNTENRFRCTSLSDYPLFIS